MNKTNKLYLITIPLLLILFLTFQKVGNKTNNMTSDISTVPANDLCTEITVNTEISADAENETLFLSYEEETDQFEEENTISQDENDDPEPDKETITSSSESNAIGFKQVNETIYAITKVNIYAGPSEDDTILGTLTYAQSALRTGVSLDGWSRVLYSDMDGYILSDDLMTVNPATDTSSYPKRYSDDSCTITIFKEWYQNAWCYIAHLELTDYTRFGTTCANGKYGNGYETTSDAADRLGAILAVNGCYSAANLNYTVVRSGLLCNGADRNMYCPAVYSNQNGLLQCAWETGGVAGIVGVNVEALVENGLVTDTFCFGPPILTNGIVLESTSTSRAQRTFIGTTGEPGDIWIVVSEGRYVDGVSAGLTYTQCGELLVTKGCTFGVPLDGGGSSTIVFQGEILNSVIAKERAVVDFLVIYPPE